MIGCIKRWNAVSAPRRLRRLRGSGPRDLARFAQICVTLVFVFLLTSFSLAATPATSEPRSSLALRALDHFYSMELDEAAADYAKLLAVEPENPDYWTGLAHVRLFQQLKRAGKFDNDLYPAAAEVAPISSSYDPLLVRSMWEALARTRTICEKRLDANARDLDANYFLGVSYAIESSYYVNVARKYLDALGPATRAREYHQRVQQIDPQNHDANLIIGSYEYGIGSIPAAFRWLVKMAGHSGSKQHGMELIRDAIVNGKRGPAAPLIMLAYIHNREKQYQYSQQMLDQLARFYPRNSFYELQAANSFRKQGDLNSAAALFRRVEKKTEEGQPGFSNRVDLPRLRFQLASTYESLRQRDLALNYYRQILPWESGKKAAYDTPQPLQAYAYLRMANLRRELGHRDAAREYYQKALEFPLPEIQKLARSALKKLSE